MGRALALSDGVALRVSGASANLSSNAGEADTAAPALDRRDISPVQNVMSFRRSFPDRWAEYLRETYRTAYGVQKAFPGIDSKTARDWISGKRDPSGSFVALVIEKDPSAIEILGRTA